MKKVCCFLCVVCGAVWGDNFIIDSHSLRHFELLLKPNQTLMINHQTKALLGILESLDNGTMRRLPIPQEWLGKNEENASKLKTYSDYTTTKTTIGSSTTTTYEKNKDFNPSLHTPSPKPKPQNVPISESHAPSEHPGDTQRDMPPQVSQDSSSSVQPKPQRLKAPSQREWDKKRIIYEQRTEFINLER
ncbi:hypothetical protein [uncultured Helicobacter sp.]|uniref:hypothetical protein n=1 Tax=uncultured Helicobacter sp. TaxID=175537 RepID=UPI003752CE67